MRVKYVCACGFRICLKAKRMSGVEQSCLGSSDMGDEVRRIWVGGWQEQKEEVVICFVRDR